MSIGHGAKIATDGLVFAFDMGNTKKSWKGKPTTNIYPDVFTSQSMRSHTKHYWDGKKWKIGDGYSHPGIPGPEGIFLGKVAKHTSGSLTSSWSGNSYGYMLRDIGGQTSGEYYTQSCYVYVSDNCNIDSIPSNIEGEQGGETSTTSGEPSSYNMSNKGTWQRISKRAISDGNNRHIPVYPAKNGVTDGSFTGFFMWGGVQVEQGSFVTPLVSADDGVASRSNTQALLDWTGTHTLTASNLQYNIDGTFEFNNSNSVITIPNHPSLNMTTGLSIEAWVQFDGNSNDFIFEKGNVNTQYRLFSHGSDIVFRTKHSGDSGYHTQNPSKSSVGVSNGVPVHIVGSWDGNTKRIYINGVLENSVSKSGNLVTTSPGASIGRFGGTSTGYYFGGKIYSVKIYNRSLTTNEIKNNFAALRQRYGI